MVTDKLKEECGVLGIYSKNNDLIAHMIGFGLVALQHRGQESAGIASFSNGKINYYKNMGLVQDVFSNKILEQLGGYISIGHVRYSTTGDSLVSNAQPLVMNYKSKPIALAHNGNLINISKIRDRLEDGGSIFQTTIDTEVIANLMAKNYKKGYQSAILDTVKEIEGAFSLVIMCEGKLVGVRDRNGLRPLCLGKLENGYVLSSESCALDVIGAEFVRDIKKGEMVIIDDEGVQSIIYDDSAREAHCAFEYVYFSRPDSIMDGKSIYATRRDAGRILFEEHPVDADIVVAVPDSGIDAAIGYSEASGIPYGIGLIKNKYIARTFIQPNQKSRELSVRLKLNPLKENIDGKRVVLIDDSVVRGTTSKRLIQNLKKAGAKEVNLLISSPPVKHSCYFGIDTPEREHLVAAVKSVEEIQEMIGADYLGYISEEGLEKAIGLKKKLCTACFSGDYPIKIDETNDKNMFEKNCAVQLEGGKNG